jgi:hypothetical protein
VAVLILLYFSIYSGENLEEWRSKNHLKMAGSPPPQRRRLFAWCNLQYLRTPNHGRLLKPSQLLIRE